MSVFITTSGFRWRHRKQHNLRKHPHVFHVELQALVQWSRNSAKRVTLKSKTLKTENNMTRVFRPIGEIFLLIVLSHFSCVSLFMRQAEVKSPLTIGVPGFLWLARQCILWWKWWKSSSCVRVMPGRISFHSGPVSREWTQILNSVSRLALYSSRNTHSFVGASGPVSSDEYVCCTPIPNCTLQCTKVKVLHTQDKHMQLSSFAELHFHLIKSLADANLPEYVETYSLPTGYLPRHQESMYWGDTTMNTTVEAVEAANPWNVTLQCFSVYPYVRAELKWGEFRLKLSYVLTHALHDSHRILNTANQQLC